MHDGVTPVYPSVTTQTVYCKPLMLIMGPEAFICYQLAAAFPIHKSMFDYRLFLHNQA